jgi:hypothetical protein
MEAVKHMLSAGGNEEARKKATRSSQLLLPSLSPSLPSSLPRHGMEAVKHMLSAGGNEEARKKAEKEKTNTDADVIQFSGCRDDQTSADAKINGRAGGREGGRAGGREGGLDGC